MADGADTGGRKETGGRRGHSRRRRSGPGSRRRRRPPGASATEPPEALQQAVRSLAEAAVRRLEEASSSPRTPRRLRLTLDLDLAGDHSVAAADLEQQIAAAADAFRREQRLFRAGRVPCARHRDPCSCELSPAPRQVFAGYGPTGAARFVDYGQRLLDLGHPAIEDLYRSGGAPVTLLESGDDLQRDLLPAYRDGADFELHGQVAAGWYRRDATERCAVSFLCVSTGGSGRPRRVQLLPLGIAEDGDDLEAAFGGHPPWSEAFAWARRALAEIERAAARHADGAAAQGLPEPAAARLQGVLEGLERRLQRRERATRRRTRHAEDRRKEARPTGMALPDLESAPNERVLRDERRGTWIVLGDRGRVHVFNESAKLVTSIRYSPPAIERRLERGVWKPGDPGAIDALRRRAPVAQAGAEGEGR